MNDEKANAIFCFIFLALVMIKMPMEYFVLFSWSMLSTYKDFLLLSFIQGSGTLIVTFSYDLTHIFCNFSGGAMIKNEISAF